MIEKGVVRGHDGGGGQETIGGPGAMVIYYIAGSNPSLGFNLVQTENRGEGQALCPVIGPVYVGSA